MGIAPPLGLLALVGLVATAQADVDWSRGLVVAEGVGIADRHAPSPAPRAPRPGALPRTPRGRSSPRSSPACRSAMAAR